LLATEKSRAGDRGIDYCLAYFRFPQVAEAATPLQAALKLVKSDASLEAMNKLVRNCAQNPTEEKFRKVHFLHAPQLPHAKCCSLWGAREIWGVIWVGVISQAIWSWRGDDGWVVVLEGR